MPSKLYFCGHKRYLPTASHQSNFIAVSPCEIKSWKYYIGHPKYEEHKNESAKTYDISKIKDSVEWNKPFRKQVTAVT